MEVVLRSETQRPCGGPVGAEREEEMLVGAVMLQFPMTCAHN